MINSIYVELRRGINLRLFLVLICIPVIPITASFDTILQFLRAPQILPFGFHRTFLFQALDSDVFAPFLPIMAVLPLAGSYVEDLKSKFVRFSVFRRGWGQYLLSKSIACFLLGGLVILLGVLLSLGLCYLGFSPMERVPQAGETLPVGLGVRCVLLFLAGGLWATLGLAMSTLMESKYIAYVSPFIIYYLLVILYERYFPKWFLIYPREWMNPSDRWPLGFWGPAILMIELTFFCSLLFVFRAGRRLREL